MSISVIMTVYNGMPHLKSSIESVIGQTYKDEIEFIVINDCSDDGSSQLLDKYENKIDWIKVIHRNKKGRVDALNMALDVAKHKYISNIDADDIWLPELLDFFVKTMENNENIHLAGSGWYDWFEEGQLSKVTISTDLEKIRKFMARGSPFLHSAVIYRRKSALSVGGYRNFIAAIDLDLWIRLAEKYKIKAIPENLAINRRHKEQIFASKTPRNSLLRSHYEVKKEAIERLNLPFYYYFYPISIYAYTFLPRILQKPVRKMLGQKFES